MVRDMVQRMDCGDDGDCRWVDVVVVVVVDDDDDDVIVI